MVLARMFSREKGGRVRSVWRERKQTAFDGKRKGVRTRIVELSVSFSTGQKSPALIRGTYVFLDCAGETATTNFYLTN